MKPYDPRTLRYCARVLLKRREEFARCAKISLQPSYWTGRAEEAEAARMWFLGEARAIDKLNKIPPKAERLAKTLCGPNQTLARKARK